MYYVFPEFRIKTQGLVNHQRTHFFLNSFIRPDGLKTKNEDIFFLFLTMFDS